MKRLFLKLAAQQNHVEAQLELGHHYAMHKMHKATPFYQLAADQGHSIAQYQLANCLQQGSGIGQDPYPYPKFGWAINCYCRWIKQFVGIWVKKVRYSPWLQ